MKLFAILVVCLAIFCGGAQTAKVLALLEKLAVKETHSMYFKQLADAGLEVTYKVADDPSIMVKKDDKHLYDHLVIFSPTVEELGGSLGVDAIVEFIDDGGNVLMAGSSSTADVLREITNHENPLVLDILTVSFSHSHNLEDPITARTLYGLQARNNARLIFVSMDLFSDEIFSSLVEKAGSGAQGVPSGNADLARALSAWCFQFQMAGVVRIDSVEHHLASSSNQPSTMKQETPSILLVILAHLSNLIHIVSLFLILHTVTLARNANHLSVFMYNFLYMIPLILNVEVHLFLKYLGETSDIPVPKLVVLGAILIISGFLLLLPSPFSPPPHIPFQKSLALGVVIIGAGLGASGASATAADRSFVSGYRVAGDQDLIDLIKILIDLNFLFFFDVLVGLILGLVLVNANTFDRAILLIVFVELGTILLALIFLV